MLMPPNGSRLSCGAGLEHSQGEFYHTARKTFSGSSGTGAASFKRLLDSALTNALTTLPTLTGTLGISTSATARARLSCSDRLVGFPAHAQMMNRHRLFPSVSLNPIEKFRGGAKQPFLTHGLNRGGAGHRRVARRIETPSFVDPKQTESLSAV